MLKLVYYTSRVLRGAKERYPSMKKLAFALITAARKLKPYFQAYMMVVLTDKLLRRATSNPEAAERIALGNRVERVRYTILPTHCSEGIGSC